MLVIIVGALLLGSCSFTGYPAPQEPAPRSPSKAPLPAPAPAPTVKRNDCPETETARLILAGQYQQAKFLLDEDLDRATDELIRSCILTTMGWLSVLPESEYFNIERAQDFQSLARVNGAVRRGGLQLRMLDRALTTLIASHLRTEREQQASKLLQQELKKKDAALERLKRLTLGD